MRLFCILLLSAISLTSFSEDTTMIRVHDQVDMTWNGHYKNWGVFPDGNDTYRKVMLHYTMGCASTGCSGWDYNAYFIETPYWNV